MDKWINGLKWCFPKVLWHHNRDEKRIYLTFDDGPTPDVTIRILEMLDKYHAKATFFCLAHKVKNHSELLQHIKDRGHATGHHGFHHIDGWRTSNEEYIKNITKATKTFPSPLFRPPYGRLKLSQYRSLKDTYRIVMWDVLSYDFKQNLNVEKRISKITRKTKNGTIIVFHDTQQAYHNLEAMLPAYIEHFTARNYQFAKLS